MGATMTTITQPQLRDWFEQDYPATKTHAPGLLRRGTNGRYTDLHVYAGWRMYQACAARLTSLKALVWRESCGKHEAQCAVGWFSIEPSNQGGFEAWLLRHSEGQLVGEFADAPAAKLACDAHRLKLLLKEFGLGDAGVV
jgi:hypothetical protein